MRTLFSFAGNLIALAAAFGLLARYVSPQIFWPPSVVALLLPVLLLATLVFLILQLTRGRWRSAILPAVVLCLSLSIAGRLFAWPGDRVTLAPDAPTVTVLTGNQRMFRAADGKDRDPREVETFFRHHPADVILMQEVWPERRKTNYLDVLRAGTGHARRHQQEKTYMATYADQPEEIAAYFTDSDYNGILVTDVSTEIGKIRFINTHLRSNKISNMAEGIRGEESVSDQLSTLGHMFAGYGRTTRRRAEQAEHIRLLVDESPYPVILGGDFNDVPSSYAYNVILSPRLQDAWAVAGAGLGTTFTGPIPGLRIDYFLVDTALQVVHIKQLDSPWSDHRMLKLQVTR